MVSVSARSVAPRLLGLAGVLFLVSCGGAGVGGEAVPAVPGAPSQNLVIKMRDTPVEAADHVFVTIERVDVYRKVDTGDETEEDGTKVVRETVTSVPGFQGGAVTVTCRFA